MKRLFLILLALAICFSAVACSKAGAPEIEDTDAENEIVTPVSGKWTCSVKLSHVLTEAQHTVWSEKLTGELTFTLVFENDGNVKVFTNSADATAMIKSYLMASGYGEAAATMKADLDTKDLSIGNKLGDLKYSFADNTVELSSQAKLKLSEDGKKLIPDLESCYVHHDGEEKCQWFERLINEMEFERA